MDGTRSDVCGCGGKGTNNPYLLRLMEIIERAEAKQKAEEAGLKLEPPEQPQRRSGI